VLEAIERDVYKLLSSNPDIFSFKTAETGFADWRDFQTRGVISFAKALDQSTIAAHDHDRVPSPNQSYFARVLAKIAHAYTVFFVGLDGFAPFLPDVILGKSEDVGRYVGGEGKVIPAHKLHLLLHHLEPKPSLTVMIPLFTA
jgi:hypothetical protein